MSTKDDIDALFESMTSEEKNELAKQVNPNRIVWHSGSRRKPRIVVNTDECAEPDGTDIDALFDGIDKLVAENGSKYPEQPGPAKQCWCMLGSPLEWGPSQSLNAENFAAAYPRQWWALTEMVPSETTRKVIAAVAQNGRLDKNALMLLWQEADRLEVVHNAKLRGVYRVPEIGERVEVTVILGKSYMKQTGKGVSQRLRFVTEFGWQGHLDIGRDPIPPGIRQGVKRILAAEVMFVMPGDYVVLRGGERGWRFISPDEVAAVSSYNPEDYE